MLNMLKMNEMVPVAAGSTVAVKVTASPKSDGLLLDDNVTAVVAAATVMFTGTDSSSRIPFTVAVPVEVGVNTVEAAPPDVASIGGATVPPLAVKLTKV